MWVAAYGPKALALTGEVGDGFILQLADPAIAAWTIGAVRDAAAAAGRDPDDVTICVAAPAYVTDGTEAAWPTAGTSAAGSAAWSATTWPTSSPATATPRPVPQALTDYIAGREGYDYNTHGQAGNDHVAFVSDEIVDRFCLVGPVEEQVRRLAELEALGVDQFAVYLQHDDKDGTLRAYGEKVIPAVADELLAKS